MRGRRIAVGIEAARYQHRLPTATVQVKVVYKIIRHP